MTGDRASVPVTARHESRGPRFRRRYRRRRPDLAGRLPDGFKSRAPSTGSQQFIVEKWMRGPKPDWATNRRLLAARERSRVHAPRRDAFFFPAAAPRGVNVTTRGVAWIGAASRPRSRRDQADTVDRALLRSEFPKGSLGARVRAKLSGDRRRPLDQGPSPADHRQGADGTRFEERGLGPKLAIELPDARTVTSWEMFGPEQRCNTLR